MENEMRIAKANDLKAIIDTTKPITDWAMTCTVWTSPNKAVVRLYVNDKKRRSAAILNIDQDGNVNPQWMPGHSLTRNELSAALEVK